MNRDDLQAKVDDFHSRVYALGGGVTTNREGNLSGQRFAIVSIPGVITKFEFIDAATERLNAYEAEQGTSSRKNL